MNRSDYMMKVKPLLASLLLCSSMAAWTVPASAATSSFRDVHDSTTAVNADALRLMGVVSGSGNNSFSPNAYLTRAEFCVMAVKVMGRGDEVDAHTTRTIFTDVTAAHWARGYVNLASSITLGGKEEKGGRLISGVGTGAFLPDDQITYAQAVTILMRMLGYGDTQAGAVWPAGYLNLARSIHLTDGIQSADNAPITRAQAAQLFVNLLSSKTEGGELYAGTLGSVKENVILLAVNVTGDDARPGAIRTSAGVYHPAVDGVIPTALQGRRGTLLLNQRSEILSFFPDESAAVTVTLSGDAQAAFLKSADGTRYSIAASTPAYTTDQSKDTTWGDIWVELRSGAQVTLFLDGGKVIGVYCAGVGQTVSEAYVVTDKLTSASFHQLTGGVSNYTIKKDGEPIQRSDIQPYDVVTYDSVSNTLTVSDLRLNCIYETAFPNPDTPSSITVLGHEFPVLDCALDSISQFKLGDSVSLLLTADGQIAGMAKPSAQTRSTATGIAGSDSVQVDLPNGGMLELKGSIPKDLQDRVVTVSASKGDRLNASRIASTSIPGDFDLTTMTLGEYPVAAGVKVYEQIGTSSMVPLSLAALEADVIPQRQLSAYHRNTSGFVDAVILNAVTGDAYTYGIMEEGTAISGDGDLTATNRTVTVVNSGSGYPETITGTAFRDGGFGGVAASTRKIGEVPVAAGIVELTPISGVKRADFFEKDGLWYVNANGTVYPVSARVEGYIKATGEWFRQKESERLAAIRAFSNDMTVYLDPVGKKVRIIVTN